MTAAGTVAVVTAVLLLMAAAGAVAACPRGGEEQKAGCKGCILRQLKRGCPGCRPRLRCLAGCLWNGVRKGKCVSTCDTPKVKPRLSDCKRCLSACKCSCIS